MITNNRKNTNIYKKHLILPSSAIYISIYFYLTHESTPYILEKYHIYFYYSYTHYTVLMIITTVSYYTILCTLSPNRLYIKGIWIHLGAFFFLYFYAQHPSVKTICIVPASLEPAKMFFSYFLTPILMLYNIAIGTTESLYGLLITVCFLMFFFS